MRLWKPGEPRKPWSPLAVKVAVDGGTEELWRNVCFECAQELPSEREREQFVREQFHAARRERSTGAHVPEVPAA
ncbi:hypothetical protein MVI01_71560 [Myxococcus virescens]|uniref:Uncharacterized protein n=1 Tax=Myxococcus virescens TaxID=83456 RepID=A0A511HP51_9BACT|nr:hypothetical protein MVI01_71560 [Myxococcus virescens]